MPRKHVSTIPVVYELLPHSVLSKSIIELDVIMRFNKPFCESEQSYFSGMDDLGELLCMQSGEYL